MATDTQTPPVELGDLPFEGLYPAMETIQVGDIGWDRNAGWIPFVGPLGAPWEDWLGDHFRHAARIKPEYIYPGWALQSMHHPILEGSSVLRKVDNEWRWTEPERDWLGRKAFLVPEIMAMRNPVVVQEGTPRRPIAEWMSRELQELIRTNAGDLLVRGLVRRNHRMVIPMEIFETGDRDRIVQWVEEEYARTRPTEVIAYRRVHTERQREALANRFTTFVTTTAHTGLVHRQGDGVTINFEYRRRVTRTEERFDYPEAWLEIPRAIFDQGEGAVERYIAEQIELGNANIEDWHEGEWEETNFEHEFRELERTDYRTVYRELNPEEPEEDEDAEPEEEQQEEATPPDNTF